MANCSVTPTVVKGHIVFDDDPIGVGVIFFLYGPFGRFSQYFHGYNIGESYGADWSPGRSME